MHFESIWWDANWHHPAHDATQQGLVCLNLNKPQQLPHNIIEIDVTVTKASGHSLPTRKSTKAALGDQRIVNSQHSCFLHC
jgi:hypothetical protein